MQHGAVALGFFVLKLTGTMAKSKTVDSEQQIDTTYLWYVSGKGTPSALVAAPTEEAARGIPPVSNWKDVAAFTGWEPEDAAQYSYVRVGTLYTAARGAFVVAVGGYLAGIEKGALHDRD